MAKKKTGREGRHEYWQHGKTRNSIHIAMIDRHCIDLTELNAIGRCCLRVYESHLVECQRAVFPDTNKRDASSSIWFTIIVFSTTF